ncbi:MAG: hypothetical protein R6V75_08530, partial [Bacteroidales bacterium]
MSTFLIALIAVVLGLALLIWSAGWFVDGSAATAGHLGMPPLLIGMMVVGFGTSAPELVVSTLAASQGNPGIALGNAYGSNIANLALILGITALLKPISVSSGILRKELPLLTGVTLITVFLLWNHRLTMRGSEKLPDVRRATRSPTEMTADERKQGIPGDRHRIRPRRL